MGVLSAVGRMVRVMPFSRGLRLVIFAGCLTAFLVLVSDSLPTTSVCDSDGGKDVVLSLFCVVACLLN